MKPLRPRLIRPLVLTIVWVSILAVGFLFFESLLEEFQYLPKWLQYPIIALAIIVCFGDPIAALVSPFLPARPIEKADTDEIKCVHCRTTIHPNETACSNCGWTWLKS